jgi:hypothetical protein
MVVLGVVRVPAFPAVVAVVSGVVPGAPLPVGYCHGGLGLQCCE